MRGCGRLAVLGWVLFAQSGFAQLQDVTDLTEIALGNASFDRRTNTSRLTATVTNLSPDPLVNIRLVVNNIPTGVTLSNQTGVTQTGVPVIEAVGLLPPGAEASVVLEFGNPSRVRLDVKPTVQGDTNVFVLFGPKEYVRSAGPPTPVIDAFSVQDPTAPFQIALVRAAVSSASITLNGIAIFSPREFAANAKLASKSIVLQPNNQLVVELRGGPGTSLTVWIVGCCSAPAPLILDTTTAPTSGQAGVTSISITGSGFPSGTIQPADANVTLEPLAGGAAVSTKADSVTTVAGDTRRLTFLIPSSISVPTPTPYLVSVSGSTTAGVPFASSNQSALTVIPPSRITSVNPSSGQAGESLMAAITGQFIDFVQGVTQAQFGAGISVGGASEGAFGPVTVTSPTTASVQIQINPSAANGPRDVTVRTGLQQATAMGGFSVGTSNPTISDFTPKSAPAGTLVTLTGANLAPNPQVTLSKQGGGTMEAPVATSSSTVLSFTVPSGAATGTIGVAVGAGMATSPAPLVIVPAKDFTLSALPPIANLIQGQSASYVVKLDSPNGFGQLAALAVSGVPAGVTASFAPQQISAGPGSVLTLTAPVGQPLGTANLTVSATATIDGIPVSQSAIVALDVQPVTTSFIGRTVVDDALQTPLASVTVNMLGKDGNGGTTGCSGSTVSDAAGNFALTNLPPTCVGRQLIGFDGLTATSPPGKYAGVNLVYDLQLGQVTTSPVLVHLPRIDDEETFYVQQNAPEDQSYSYKSVPGLSVVVYKNTTFTMPDGSQPDPFPLVGVQVPVDRLPDDKPPVPTMLLVFIVAFQPANAHASQPVAVYYPNTLQTQPGVNMPLMTLDPTRGAMVPYGTATVAPDGKQIVPDLDPAFPGNPVRDREL